MTELILASTSRYRQELLTRLRVPFRCIAPQVDEAVVQARYAAHRAEQLAEHLAEAKARSVAALEPDAIVLGSDQVCVCAGQVLNKPGTVERACEELAFLAGKQHALITAVCLIHAGRTLAFKDVTTLQMRPLSAGEIARYVAADEPLDCAGSYKLESLGISLFESIQSEDHTAITGLPLMLLARQLRQLGLNVP
ncbi:Maf-like protein YceF [Anatilimnocola aggregata]|uniref:7-methyl-GTP pyrophosphatase n=1 Tax=Anatilimnocola aggregata TaxID=2528021 RepID=A0A517YB31_9BACT|nr:Maf family protein [Anatilimnocola aggregata]QDU27401.1 Maf-like protein YceF [Anatilimnocola aggregata]